MGKMDMDCTCIYKSVTTFNTWSLSSLEQAICAGVLPFSSEPNAQSLMFGSAPAFSNNSVISTPVWSGRATAICRGAIPDCWLLMTKTRPSNELDNKCHIFNNSAEASTLRNVNLMKLFKIQFLECAMIPITEIIVTCMYTSTLLVFQLN